MKAETFQDPSELMKRALFRTLLIVAVAVVLYMFCVVSEQTSLQRAKEKKANLSKQLADWKGTVARKAEVKAEYRDISLTVTNKEKLLLERDQVLGDYESTATTLLDPIAKLPVCRFRNPDLNSTNEWKSLEVLLSDKKKEPRRLPLPATGGSLPLKSLPQLYARQPICLTCKGPRNKIITFLCAVEDIAAGGGKTKRWLEQISEAEKQKEEFKQLPKEEREEIEKAMTDDLETLSRMSGKLSGMTLEAFTFKAPQGKDDKWGEAVMVFEWPIKLEKKDGTP